MEAARRAGGIEKDDIATLIEANSRAPAQIAPYINRQQKARLQHLPIAHPRAKHLLALRAFYIAADRDAVRQARLAS